MVVRERRVQQLSVVVVLEALIQRRPDAVACRAVDLALDDHRVHLAAALVDSGVVEDRHLTGLVVYFDDGRVDLAGVGQRQLAGLGLVVGYLERRPVDVTAVERDGVGELARQLGDVREDGCRDADERDRRLGVCGEAHEPVGELDVGLLAAEHARADLDDLAAQLLRRAHHGPQAGHRELARVGAGEADVGVRRLVVAGGDMDLIGAHAEDVGCDLRSGGLVALPLRAGPDRDRHLAVEIEPDDRRLAVARERQRRVDDPRLTKVVGAGVERRADADADPLAAAGARALARQRPLVVDQLERAIEHRRIVAGVVDAAVRRLVGELLGLHVVELAQLDSIEAQLVRDDVDDPFDHPQVLQPRIAAVGSDRTLVGQRLGVVDADVLEAVVAGHDLRPDHRAERLVAQIRAGVVERPDLEAEDRAVAHHGHLDVEEGPLVSVCRGREMLPARLAPLDRAARLA